MSKYQALIDALKAGPTEGKWRKSKIAEVMIGTRRLCNVTAAESLPIGKDVERANINAAYIAAANPDTIRSLLADLERAEKALSELLACGGVIADAEDHELRAAIQDQGAEQIVKVQAVAVLNARTALSQLKGVQ